MDLGEDALHLLGTVTGLRHDGGYYRVDTNLMRGVEPVTLPLLLTLSLSGAVGCTSQDTPISNASLGLTREMFRGDDAPCYNRTVQPQTAVVVDTHVHFRPFGGPAIPFEEVVQYFEETGVLFANIAGIGQMLPVTSSCTYYLDCPGTLVTPTLKNDFVNAADLRDADPGRHPPDARDDVPRSIAAGIG